MPKRGCGKLRYKDELGAKLALASTYRSGTPSRREECRYFKCPKCHGWHLTSKEEWED